MTIIILFLSCAIVFVVNIRKFKKADSTFYYERSKFVEYLDSKNDIETLKHIGEINMFGVRERWYPRYTNLVPYLEEKISQTGDVAFIDFLEEYQLFIKRFLTTMPFIVLSIIIPIAYVLSLFRS